MRKKKEISNLQNNSQMQSLADLKEGKKGKIIGILPGNESIERLVELGLVIGEEVLMIKKAPLGDPLEIKVMNYNLCIRKSEASFIEIGLIDQ
ncbi:MAG: ferrous iron transport protein A [Leptospiraceae bacterium]|nr:ferrous iron transport protein A [Leptospiraceae bacterium]MCP5495134.1 ferrous iron transport protein A [Leptospiraceae bacterium]